MMVKGWVKEQTQGSGEKRTKGEQEIERGGNKENTLIACVSVLVTVYVCARICL